MRRPDALGLGLLALALFALMPAYFVLGSTLRLLLLGVPRHLLALAGTGGAFVAAVASVVAFARQRPRRVWDVVPALVVILTMTTFVVLLLLAPRGSAAWSTCARYVTSSSATRSRWTSVNRRTCMSSTDVAATALTP